MKYIRYLLVFILGILITVGISNAYDLKASLVTYDNKQTTLASLDVNGALNELGILAITNITSLENEINDGKSVISTAITDKGVTPSGNDFESLASSVSKVYDKGYSLGDADGYNRGYDQGKIDGAKATTVKRASLGTSYSSGTRTFSATSIPNYQALTSENFAVVTTSINDNDSSGASSYEDRHMGWSYNASTGVLTVNPMGGHAIQKINGNYTYPYASSYTVYVYYTE